MRVYKRRVARGAERGGGRIVTRFLSHAVEDGRRAVPRGVDAAVAVGDEQSMHLIVADLTAPRRLAILAL